MSPSCHLGMGHRCLDNVPGMRQRYRKDEHNSFLLLHPLHMQTFREFGWQIVVAVVVIMVYVKANALPSN